MIEQSYKVNGDVFVDVAVADLKLPIELYNLTVLELIWPTRKRRAGAVVRALAFYQCGLGSILPSTPFLGRVW